MGPIWIQLNQKIDDIHTLGILLTLFQPEEADCAHHITASTPGFENLTTSLNTVCIINNNGAEITFITYQRNSINSIKTMASIFLALLKKTNLALLCKLATCFLP